MSTQTVPPTTPTSGGTWGIQRWVRWAWDTARRRAAFALVDQGVVSATNFLTNVLVANYCLPRQFGIFYLAISLMHFVKGIQEQLISAPYTIYHHRREHDALARYSGSTLIHQLALAAVTLIALAVLAWGLHRGGHSPSLVSALHVLIIVCPFFLFREYVRKLLFAHFHFGGAVLVDLVVAACQLAGIAALVLFDNLTVVKVFVCIALASLAACILWYRRFRLPLAVRRGQVRADWRENWAFGRWALATHLMGCSTPYFMPWYIKFLRSEDVTALYAACQTLVGLGNMLLTGVSNFLSPKSAHAFATEGRRGLLRVLMKAALLFVGTLGPFCALLAVTGDRIPRWAFGAEYNGLAQPLLYLALALLANALGMTAGNGIWAVDRPSLNMTADAACLVTTFGGGYYWINEYGATGAAAAVLAGAVVACLLRWSILIWVLERIGTLGDTEPGAN